MYCYKPFVMDWIFSTVFFFVMSKIKYKKARIIAFNFYTLSTVFLSLWRNGTWIVSKNNRLVKSIRCKKILNKNAERWIHGISDKSDKQKQ